MWGIYTYANVFFIGYTDDICRDMTLHEEEKLYTFLINENDRVFWQDAWI